MPEADIDILLKAHPFHLEETSHVCQLLKTCAEKMTGNQVNFALCPGFLDARHFVHAQIPCVTWGPGIYEKAHTADEYIALDDIMTAADVFCALIESI